MTTTATIRRGTAPKKRPVVKRHARPVAPKKSVTRSALARVPIRPETWRRIGRAALGIVLAGGAAGAVFAMGLPGMVGTELGEAAGRAGFAVKRIDIRGIDQMERLPVYAVALDQDTVAMPLVDLSAIREKLLRFPWIADARVSRRLPDTLVVDIVERKPVAIWQYQGKLALIDKDGVVLAPVALDAMPDGLPLVIGPAANRQAEPLAALLDAAPALKPTLAGATWVGERRWDLRFHSGETLALPEGDKLAADALVKFARMDGVARLLGQGFVRFDMRVPGKFVVRVSKEPGKMVASPAAQKEPV
jgi:cell division protein FtsQ